MNQARERIRLNVRKLPEKARAEFYATCHFIVLIRQHVGIAIKFQRLGSPPEPDIICSYQDSSVGIEVAHLYGTERDARVLLDRARPIETTMNHMVAHAMVPLGDRFAIDLNRLLIAKSKKKYPMKTILLVRNVHPLFNRSLMERYDDLIAVPSHHPFQEIWVLCDRDASSGAIQYFPERRSYDGPTRRCS